LGASHGVTAKIISNIVGSQGFVFCLDISPEVVRKLVLVCEKNHNMCPILANALLPATYEKNLPKQVDVIYQDIAQKDQVEIFLMNIKQFLKPKCFAMLNLKARSIDVTKSTEEILNQAIEKLKKEVKIISYISLEPEKKGHYFIIVSNS